MSAEGGNARSVMQGRIRSKILATKYMTESEMKSALIHILRMVTGHLSKCMSNPKRMGSAVINAAEILHANCSCGDGNWKDHAMQCIPPKTAAMQMGKETRMMKNCLWFVSRGSQGE